MVEDRSSTLQPPSGSVTIRGRIQRSESYRSTIRRRNPLPTRCLGRGARGLRYFLSLVSTSPESAAMNASWGTSTRPTIFIRFLPSFCFSRSLRLRVMSPP